MNIGKSLKMALLNSGKTQQELANDLGVNAVIVNRHFNTKFINLKLVGKYASYFGLKPSELIALSE